MTYGRGFRSNSLFTTPFPSMVPYSIVSPTLDASGEQQICVGEIDWDGDDASKTIVGVRVKLNNKTLDSGASLLVGLADFDSADHTRYPKHDGTLDQSVTVAAGDLTAYVVNEFTFGSSRSVTRGEKLCVVFELQDRTAGGINVQYMSTLSTSAHPTEGTAVVTNYVNGSYAPGGAPNLEFVFSDASVGYYRGDTLARAGASYGFAVGDSDDGTSFIDGDEVGLYWEPSRASVLTGVQAVLAVSAYTADTDICLYVNGSLVQSWTVYGSEYINSGSSSMRIFFRRLTTPTVVLPGDVVRIVAYASSGAGTRYVGAITYDNNNARDWVHRGEVLKVTHRNRAGGTWYEPHADSDNAFVWFEPLGEYLAPSVSMEGTKVISGNVEHSGSPFEGAVVYCIRQSDLAIASTTTDASGNYSFSVQDGYTYHVCVEVTVTGQRYSYGSIFDLTPATP